MAGSITIGGNCIGGVISTGSGNTVVKSTTDRTKSSKERTLELLDNIHTLDREHLEAIKGAVERQLSRIG